LESDDVVKVKLKTLAVSDNSNVGGSQFKCGQDYNIPGILVMPILTVEF